jgi:hypothetical protein
MRVLRPVVQSLVLSVFNVQSLVPVCRSVALEFVGDQYARCAAVLLEELSHQPLGRMPVAPALHQYVKHCTVLVHRTPQPVLPALDGDHHFVEMPLVSPRASAVERMRRAMPRPNFTDQRRTVSYDRSMPRAASNSSTMRRLSGKR